jgi:hypothetical protein
MQTKFRAAAVLFLCLLSNISFAQRVVKVSTAYDLRVWMASSTDHIAAKTGLTLTITEAKSGTNSLSSISPTVTEIGNGWYNLALTTAHLDTVGDTALHITGSGADSLDIALVVRSNVLGDTLPANVTQINSNSSAPANLVDLVNTGYNATTHAIATVNAVTTAFQQQIVDSLKLVPTTGASPADGSPLSDIQKTRAATKSR